MAWFQAVRGARAQGPRHLSLRLNQPCRGSSHNKEESHGEEEEGQEEIEVNGVKRAPRIGAAPSTSNSRDRNLA